MRRTLVIALTTTAVMFGALSVQAIEEDPPMDIPNAGEVYGVEEDPPMDIPDAGEVYGVEEDPPMDTVVHDHNTQTTAVIDPTPEPDAPTVRNTFDLEEFLRRLEAAGLEIV